MQRKAQIAAVIGAGVVLFVAVFPHLGHSLDDAFITYRYARNLAEGQGLVFNAGEHHLGTTAPGWAVVLAAGALVSGTDGIPVVSGFLSVILLVVSFVLLSRRSDAARWPFVLAVSMVMAAACRWLVEVLGFEGFALTAVVLLALEAANRKRPWVAGFLWAGAVMLRPDAGVLGAVAGLIEWRRTRSFPWRLLLAFVTGLSLEVVFLWCVAGSVVPVSFAVKASEAKEAVFASTGGYTKVLMLWAGQHCGWAWLPFCGFSALGWFVLARRNPEKAWPILAVTMTNVVVYPLLGVPFAPWYLILPLIVLIVGFAFLLVESAWRPGWRPLAVVGLVIALVWVAPQVSWAVRLGKEPPDGRMDHLLEVAARVSQMAAPDDKVIAVEIGFLGFALRQPIIDVIGLGTPGSLEAMVNGTMVDHLYRQDPAFLAYNTTFSYLLEPFFEDPRFTREWELECVIPAQGRHQSDIEIYRRAKPPAP